VLTIGCVYGRDNDKKAYLNNGSNWVESSNLAIPINITNSITETIWRRVGPDFFGYKQMNRLRVYNLGWFECRSRW
jgi:hypothetical protein